MPAVAEQTVTEGEQRQRAFSGPAHSSLFHSLLNQGLGSGSTVPVLIGKQVNR